MKTVKSKSILLGALLLLSTLVIGNIRLCQFIYPLLWVYFAFFVFPLLSKLNKWPKISLKILVGTVYIIVGTTYVLATLYFILGFVLCGYGSPTVEYISKANSRFKIIGRDFSCYGTTNDLVLYKQFSISKSIKIETYYKTAYEYQKPDIDTITWKRIDGYYKRQDN